MALVPLLLFPFQELRHVTARRCSLNTATALSLSMVALPYAIAISIGRAIAYYSTGGGQCHDESAPNSPRGRSRRCYGDPHSECTGRDLRSTYQGGARH